MTDYLLDTSGRARLYVSIITLSELLEGAEDPDEVERQVFETGNVLGLHRQHARRAGLIQRRARTGGRRMGENDAWIAATAALGNLEIVGDDDEAFANRPALAYSNFRSGKDR